MNILFSDKDNETSSGYVVPPHKGGNPILKDMAVPAGLFFLQKAFSERTPSYKKDESSGEMIPESLYDRLFTLVEDKSTRKTRKHRKKKVGGKRKTMKNN